MPLTPGYLALAEALQAVSEAAMTHNDLHRRIRDAVANHPANKSTWTDVVDVMGDDKSGHVVYSSGGSKLKKASYKIDGANGATVDADGAADVMPRTTYETKKAKESATPETKEAATVPETAALRLVESEGQGFLDTIPVRESAGAQRASYPVKLISPGTGSTAHYPAAVLERDGPRIFKAGTLMFWNHPTIAEESARPEGDLNNLAAILTSDAKWDANGKKGPGLYAQAKPMADYAQRVAERAPYIGLSIRAGGKGTGRMVDGKPELASLEYAESVDYVTKAGRGGLALVEAARDAGLLTETAGSRQQEGELNAQEVQRLVEAAIQPYQQRLIVMDAREAASGLLALVTLPEVAKQKIIARAVEAAPSVTVNGVLDQTKFGEIVAREAKAEGEYLAQVTGSGRIFGMGGGAPVIDAKESARLAEIAKNEEAENIAVFEAMGMPKEAATLAAKGRAA